MPRQAARVQATALPSPYVKHGHKISMSLAPHQGLTKCHCQDSEFHLVSCVIIPEISIQTGKGLLHISVIDLDPYEKTSRKDCVLGVILIVYLHSTAIPRCHHLHLWDRQKVEHASPRTFK